MVLLEARGLVRKPVISDFDLTLDAGELVVLVGPSGSGKTLLLRALADLDPVDAGQRIFDGVACEDTDPQTWRRRVRYVHQRAPRLAATVYESLERVRSAVPAGTFAAHGADVPAGLDVGQRTADLSGGEAQKLALFIALRTGARVLLLDEPTSALDAASSAEAERAVRDYVDAGNAALWVSHDEQLAERFGARVRRLS